MRKKFAKWCWSRKKKLKIVYNEVKVRVVGETGARQWRRKINK